MLYRSIAIDLLLVVCLSTSTMVRAEGIQPFEAGTYPIRERIEVIDKNMAAITTRLQELKLSTKERDSRTWCLQQYITEKKHLEDDLQVGKKLSRNPLVFFLTDEDEVNCTKGLTFPSSK